MTRRVLTAAFAVCLALPAGAAAQMGPTAFDRTPAPRFRVTPFVGYLTGFVRQEQWIYTQSGTQVSTVDVDTNVEGGPGAGVHVEAPFRGLFGVSAAAGLFVRDESAFVVLNDGQVIGLDGTNTFMARLNAAFRMPTEESEFVLRRLDAAVYAGGVILHDRYRNTYGTADLLDNATHFGINLGLSAELPFANDRFAVQVGAEDNIILWRGSSLEPLAALYQGRPSGATHVSATAKRSMSWLLRAGVSIRIP
jgi:hypothetical protein